LPHYYVSTDVDIQGSLHSGSFVLLLKGNIFITGRLYQVFCRELHDRPKENPSRIYLDPSWKNQYAWEGQLWIRTRSVSAICYFLIWKMQ